MGRTQRLDQPREFGKYQLVALLAHSRMADVYKAKSHGVEGFEKVYCVKMFHHGLAAHPQFVEALIDEAKRSVALSHANIAQVIDLGLVEEVNRYYVAMEYVSGFDLARTLRLAQSCRYAWPQNLSVFIASEIAKALDYAHRRKDFNFNNLNILHRALRPENVMLSFDGEIKITDFGLSRALESTPALDEEEERQRILYSPPEVLRGKPYNRQSDIFALGLLLYQMITGVHPYDAPSVDEVRSLATAAQIPPASTRADIPRQVQQIMDSMLVADPAGRAQSAGQIYEELIGYIFGNALEADPRLLSLALQDLRQHEKTSDELDLTAEVGLQEISQAELNTAFATGGAFNVDPDRPSTGSLSPSAIPSSRVGNAAAGVDERTLPGALEDIFQSAAAGNGKAVLLSGRFGRGRQSFLDRLVEAAESRPGSISAFLHTSPDDRFRPFGVFTDLLVHLANVDHDDAQPGRVTDLLQRWGVSPAGQVLVGSLLDADGAGRAHWETRRQATVEIITALLKNAADTGATVLIIDRVENLDHLSMEALRGAVAAIGDLPALVVLGTLNEDMVRETFDAGTPQDLESIRVSGEPPAPPDTLQDLSPEADLLLTLLSLADKPLDRAAAAQLLGFDVDGPADELLAAGAIRLPRQDSLRADVTNWLTWRKANRPDGQVPRQASALARHYSFRATQKDRLAPTLVRLYATAGDRRQALPLAERYASWLQRNAWHRSAMEFHQHLSQLIHSHGLGAPKMRVHFVLEAAEIALDMALIDKCRSLLEPLSAFTETVRDEAGFVGAQLLLGRLALQQDDLDEARAHFQRSVQTAAGIQDRELLARSTLALASWYERYGDPASALDRLESAVNLYRRFGTGRMDLKARAQLLQRTARMWADRGMLRRAYQPVQDLMQLARAVPYPSIRCRAAIAQGRLAAHMGDLMAAGDHYDEGIGLARSHGLTALAIELLRERAGLNLRFDRFEEAVSWANQVVGYAESHGDYYSEQRARDIRALALATLGRDTDAALQQLRASLRRATERGVPKDVFRGHDLLARALTALGHTDEARHHRAHADEIGRALRISWAA